MTPLPYAQLGVGGKLLLGLVLLRLNCTVFSSGLESSQLEDFHSLQCPGVSFTSAKVGWRAHGLEAPGKHGVLWI